MSEEQWWIFSDELYKHENFTNIFQNSCELKSKRREKKLSFDSKNILHLTITCPADVNILRIVTGFNNTLPEQPCHVMEMHSLAEMAGDMHS